VGVCVRGCAVQVYMYVHVGVYVRERVHCAHVRERVCRAYVTAKIEAPRECVT